MEKPHALLIFAVLLMTAPVSAEVMDKEMSVPQIWEAFGWALLIAFVTAAIWRWLLVPSFFLGLASGLGFTWTEWFNSSVGAAMRAEAGEIYGLHINGSLSLLLLAHVLLWFVATRRSLVRFFHSSNIAPQKLSRDNLVFAALLWAVALLGSFGGFGATAWIWLSPPFLIATLFLITTLILFLRGSTRHVAVV